jgi:hypothetical protein
MAALLKESAAISFHAFYLQSKKSYVIITVIMVKVFFTRTVFVLATT